MTEADPMKILMLAHRFPPSIGGVETHLLELSKNLIALGHQVTVFSSNLESIGSGCKHPGSLSHHTIEGIDVYRFSALQLASTIDPAAIIPGLFTKTLLTANRFDIIHAHSYGYFSSISAAIIAPLFISSLNRAYSKSIISLCPSLGMSCGKYGYPFGFK